MVEVDDRRGALGGVDMISCRDVRGLQPSTMPLLEAVCRPAAGLRDGKRGDGGSHGRNVVGAMRAEIGAFWKILTQQSVGVLVGAALPWAVRIAEIDLD